MSLTRVVALVAAVLVSSAPAMAQDARKLDISFDNGKVTLVAQNVTLREILAEWARKGGSRIVNAEKLTGAPVVMTEFRDQPEGQVLNTLLRDVPGIGVSMRDIPATGGSAIGAVFILATRAPSSGSSVGSSAALPANRLTFENPPQPQAQPRMIQGSPDDEIPPVRPIAGDKPPVTANAPAGQPTPNPSLRTGPGGVVVPGVITPGQGAPATAPGPGPAAKPPATTGRGGGGGTR